MAAALPDDASSQWDETSPAPSSREAGNAVPHNPAGEDFAALDARSAFARYAGEDGAAPLPDAAAVPERRRLRWEREAGARSRFAREDEACELRTTAARLRGELVDAQGAAAAATATEVDRRRVDRLEEELLTLSGRDPEFMMAVSSELLERAEAAGNDAMAEKYRLQVEDARSCIPQLNMHGLWVGKYESGYELVNVTYSGDTLVATKVTGDRNVPKGEASFTVDLAPRFSPHADGEPAPALEPIELTPEAAKQWDRRFLPRHAGRGQVAAEGFRNAQWMEGQMILVGRFFSFAWVPLGHQVFFGRPSAELVVKMLREARAEEGRTDRGAVLREAAEGMWEETYWDEAERGNDSYYVDEGQGCFE